MKDLNKITEKFVMPIVEKKHRWGIRLSLAHRKAARRKLRIIAFCVSMDSWNEIKVEFSPFQPPLGPFISLAFCGIPIFESPLAVGNEILIVLKEL